MKSEFPPIAGLSARAFVIPTDKPEADGTLAWDKTTLVVVEAHADTLTGLGYTYADASVAGLVVTALKDAVLDIDAADVAKANQAMWRAVRNLGRSGLAASAIAAVDIALWDLKAKLLDLPLVTLLGAARERVAIYGSGGFTSYDCDTLCRQLAGWVERDGCGAVKMKIGSEPAQDHLRIRAARAAVGTAALFVDANGAFTPGMAVSAMDMLADANVTWFEEPVSSDDREGLAFVRAGGRPDGNRSGRIFIHDR